MLNYKTVNGYQIPDLKIPDEQVTLGKYGRMRKAYLQEHRRMLFNSLLLTGELTAHLVEIDRTANERVSRMVSEMAAAQGVNEALKERVGAMNSLKAQAEEVVLNELVYA